MVKVRKSWKRALASVLSLALLLTSVYTTPVSAEETVSSGDVVTTVSGNEASELTSYVLDASDLEEVAAGQTAGYELSGLGDGGKFSVVFGEKTLIEASSKSFSDGVSVSKRINLQGAAKTTQCSVKFSTNAAADVKVYWVCGGDGRQITILGEDGNAVATTEVDSTTKNSLYISEISVPSEGTYYLGGDTSNNYIYRIEVVESTTDDETGNQGGSDDGNSGDEVVDKEQADTEGMKAFSRTYDFRDGSIVPTTTDGKSDVTSVDGTLTVKVGTQNAYGYNGAQHGVQFKAGNTIEITVPAGFGTILVANCAYSNSGTLVATMNGETIASHTVTKGAIACYDGTATTAYAVDYSCDEESVVTLAFDASFYLPVIEVEGYEPAPETVVVEEAFTRTYDFRDGSIVPTTTDGKSDVTSADGNLTVKVGTQNAYGYNGAQHGVQFKAGNTIEITVPAGSGTISVANCAYSNSGTLVATMNGETIASHTVTKGAIACYDGTDATAYAVPYSCSEESVVTLAFDASFYLPVIVVSGTEAKEYEMQTFSRDYDFRDGSIVPTTTDGKSDVTSADGNLTVKVGTQNAYGYNGAQHGTQFKAGNTIEITVKQGSGTITIGNCAYSNSGTLVVTQGDETLKTFTITKGALACYDGTDATAYVVDYTCESASEVITLAFDASFYLPIINVSGKEPAPSITEVTATVAINDANSLVGDSKITLVNASDASDVVDVTAGGEFTLGVNKIYNVTTDNSDIAVSVAGKSLVATGEEALSFAIDVVSTVVHPVVTIVDAGNVLGDTVITLTNAADATDVVTVENGKSVKLKIDASYIISTSVASVVATVGGTKMVKATSDMTALQIDVAEADLTTHTYDVWDFGAEQLESTELAVYNNKLDVDTINGWYSGATAGSEGVCILDSATYDADNNVEFKFNAGGKVNNRLRTTNTAITRYDSKSLKDIYDSSIVYTGYIYSNAAKSTDVNVQLNVKAGDIVTFVVSSNGTSSDITWMAPSGATSVQTYEGQSSQAQAMTFYCAESGLYTLYSATEKLVVARIYRERPNTVTVSGDVTAPTGADLSSAKLVFTNETTGEVIKTTFADGKYNVSLQEQYTYAISLEGANGYIVGANNSIKLKNEDGNTTFDVEIISVELVNVTGSLADLDAEAAAALELTFTSENVYVPEYTINAEKATYTAQFEKGVTYTVTEANVNDYTLDTTSVKADADTTVDIKFTKKATYAINVTLEGPSAAEAANVALTFERLLDGENGVTGELDGYVYKFTGTDNIALRNGQYKVTAVLDGYTQHITADVKVNGATVNKTIVMDAKDAAATVVPYSAEITVGSGKDYATVNEALEAVRNMNRENGERVVITIEPGDYEEMLVIDVENVTLKNASSNPSIELTNKGVDIAEGAVRITSYYGHGYSYYSMGNDCKYDEELLAVNKENGYESYTNPGSGTTDGSYWNATVVVTASGFEADGIIFENSFNQYVSKKAADDVIVKQSSAKEGTTARASMAAGDVTVQQKAYVERAAALAIYNNIYDVVFDNCKFIGRQDTLYGGVGTYAEFNECSIYGGTDYIFGGMTAIFNKCDLVFNTSEDKNDIGYITAAQQKTGRGYLMYECHVTSTVPGVDTASEYPSKAGYLGRPWQANTSEVIFYNTTIDALDAHWGSGSLIEAAGWNSSLSGESAGMCEYGTVEASGVDNSASRATWATMLTEAKTNDGVDITFEAFRRVIPEVDETVTEFVLETSSLSAFAAGAKADGDSEKAGTNNYFTILYSAKSKVDSSSKKWDDDYASSQRVNFGGAVTTNTNAIKFTTSSAATVKVWWAEGGDDNRQIGIIDGNGVTVASTDGTFTKNSAYISTLEVSAAGTYYLGGLTGNNYIFKVQVNESNGEEKAPRADWSTVDAPVVTNVVQYEADKSQVEVTVSANVGYDGADKVTVTLTDAKGNVVGTGSSSAEKFGHTIYITPSASGTYTVTATLIREGETDKVSESKTVAFVLPLEAPYVSSATCMGGGSVSVEWTEVPEATKYIVTVDGTTISVGTSLLNTTITGLTIGKTYTIKVVAVRGDETSEAGSITVKVVNEVQRKWSFTAYGSSTNEKDNGYEGNANEGSVTVYSENGKGKIVPASTDGLAFYYTEIDPETENFTLTATITVDSWKLSNGQEGFGMMVADAVGTNGDATAFWNNSYQNIATKIEYYHDGGSVTTDSSASKFSMKLGLGAIAKTGATAADIADIEAGLATMPANFVSESTTLETSAVTSGWGAGTYNLVGNYTGASPTGNLEELLTTFRLEIQRNNTGYFLRYLDEQGNVLGEKKYYDLERTALTQIDEDSIYVGFFASRNARITVTDINLTTIRPEDDEPAEARQWEYIYPVNTIESATFATTPNYELVYYGNADGRLIITDKEGNGIVDKDFTALTKERVNVTLHGGTNEFLVTFIPDPTYRPGEYQVMTSYETVTMTHTVEYKTIANQYIYVSPDAETISYEMDAGTREHPLDIYTAVKIAAPGQKIVLLEGTYNLESTLKIERGIDGTADNMIYMVADPLASTRPVLDFGGLCAGMVIAGDYWYFQGFDVTRSADAQKGIQVSGSNNVLDNLRTYKNGNTGIQISRYKGTDEWEDWPANNLILNCTSYLNADKGYEDADGFAAKLTVGDGNVFDGCIAAYNADDGWDLYAKVQSGSIGNVTIRNCVAFKNGYLVDANGNEIDAGNGNGFKMGGDSMPGQHLLENSIAFANKAKGIDSNSGPDIQVKNCTSFDNESYNVAFYTNTAVNTAYKADGVLSYKKSNAVGEQIKLKGTQVQSDVYGVTNYYFNGTSSVNSASALVDDSWFVSLDTKAAITGITRDANGIINMNGYLELTDAADANAGARMTGTASADVEVPVTAASAIDVNPYGSAADLEEIFKDTVAAVKDVTGCSNATELVNYLINKAIQMANANNIKATEGSLQILEVKVKVLAEVDGRMQYVDATVDNFPEEGVDILLPYPNGTGMSDKFNISHLVVLGCNGQVPGTMENCRYQATKDGILVHAMSASPFIITWPESTDDDASDSVVDGDGATEGTVTNTNTSGTSGSANASKNTLVASAEKTDSAKTETKTETTKTENSATNTDKATTETGKTQEEAAKDEVKVDDKTADSTVVVDATTAVVNSGTNVWAILIGIAVVAVIGVAVGVFVLRRKEDTLE